MSTFAPGDRHRTVSRSGGTSTKEETRVPARTTSCQRSLLLLGRSPPRPSSTSSTTFKSKPRLSSRISHHLCDFCA